MGGLYTLSPSWIWPSDETRLPRQTTPGAELGPRRGSLRFIRELRLWDEGPEHSSQTPNDPGHLCEEDMTEDQPAGDRAEQSVEEAPQAPRPLQPSMIFREGAEFGGLQRVSRLGNNGAPEDWGVNVIIHVAAQELDLPAGRCCGDMMAVNVPLATSPVVTHWEGEIVDGLNHSFVTCKWGASYGIDLAHWRRFAAFAPLKFKVMAAHGGCSQLHDFPYIFMRWKESFFVNTHEEGCSLSIAGFYYVCLDRRTGRIEGFYFDPNSTPYQKLELGPSGQHPRFSSYQFA